MKSQAVVLGVALVCIVAVAVVLIHDRSKVPSLPGAGPASSSACLAKMSGLANGKTPAHIKMNVHGYLCANEAGTPFFNADVTSPETQWVFEAVPDVIRGYRVKNVTHGRYLSCADNGTSVSAAVTPDKVGKDEVFVCECNNNTGTYNLMGSYGGYLGATDNGGVDAINIQPVDRVMLTIDTA